MNVKKPYRLYVQKDARKLLPPELMHLADAVNLLQHRILTRRWQWQTDKTGRFTLLKREYIDEEMTAAVASKVLRWAKENGHIVIDGQYIAGKKSYGYRMSDELEKLPTTTVNIADNDLVDRLRSFERRDYKKYTKAHRHLKKWLETMTLTCDAKIEVELCEDMTDVKREINLGAIRMIQDGYFTFSPCDYGRVHTNLTRLLRLVRKHIRINGSACVSIDIANSQPLFLGLALLNSKTFQSTSITPMTYYSNCSTSPYILVPASTKPVPLTPFHCTPISAATTATTTTIQPPTNHTTLLESTPIRSQNQSFESCNPLIKQIDIADSKVSEMTQDIGAYLETCQEGKLYEQCMDGMGWEEGKDAFKKHVWFRFLYGSNKSDKKLSEPENEDLAKLIKWFAATYPSVYAFAWNQKKRRKGELRSYRNLSCDMQRAESKLMIDEVAGRLADEYPDIPVLTIHDSYMTPPEHAETVQRLILEAFAKHGITPTLNIDDYTTNEGQHAEEDYEYAEATEDDIRMR